MPVLGFDGALLLFCQILGAFLLELGGHLLSLLKFGRVSPNYNFQSRQGHSNCAYLGVSPTLCTLS